MSNKKQSDNHNNRINTGNKKGNKKTLIINKLPNLVDTSQLVEKFKNCYCGKTIVVDLIKCSCNFQSVEQLDLKNTLVNRIVRK